MTAGDNICMWGSGGREMGRRRRRRAGKDFSGVIEKSCSAVSGVLDVRYTDIFFYFFFQQTYFSQTVGGLFGMEGK